jgi:hypothetical protein
MKTKTIFLSLLIILALRGFAQDPDLAVSLENFPGCGFQQIFTKANVSYSDLIKTYKEINARAGAKKIAADAIYDIPVVFHIVCHTPAWNIDDSIIANQVNILNGAYRKQHADTALLRSFFIPFSGDAHIQFHLATVDPNGNPTNGITRTQTTFKHFGDSLQTVDSLERVKHTAMGGIDAWPTDHYLNIWVCNMSDSRGHLVVMGYGVPPLNPIPPNWPAGTAAVLSSLQDGIVIQVHAVGSNNPLNASLGGLLTKGRALVHEVGHYLGLQHIFGSNDGSTTTSMCGMIADDGINDTPEQSTSSFDASSGFACPPAAKNSCGTGITGDLPDMWENYMDYAHDACQVMFTFEQIAIMRGVLENQRNILPAIVTGLSSMTSDRSLKIYPNPATDKLHVQYPQEINHIIIRNMYGELMLEVKGKDAAAGSYDLSNLPAGQYIILIETKHNSEVSKFVILK